MFWLQALEHRHREFLYVLLVVAHPNQLLAVGSKHHRTRKTELLLIHPIGNAVDDFITLAVLCNLYFGVII